MCPVAAEEPEEKIGLTDIGDFDHPNDPKHDPLRPHLLYRAKAEARE